MSYSPRDPFKQPTELGKSIEISEMIVYEAIEMWLINEGKMPNGAKVGLIKLNPSSSLLGG